MSKPRVKYVTWDIDTIILEINRQFPGIPSRHAQIVILKIANRVWENIWLNRAVRRTVFALIRHEYTSYDALMDLKTYSRDSVYDIIGDETHAIAKSWQVGPANYIEPPDEDLVTFIETRTSNIDFVPRLSNVMENAEGNFIVCRLKHWQPTPVANTSLIDFFFKFMSAIKSTFRNYIGLTAELLARARRGSI